MIVNSLFWISLSGASVLSVLSYLKTKKLKQLIVTMALLIVCAFGYYSFIQSIFENDSLIISRGSSSDTSLFVAILYLSMFLGMLCHYLYFLFITPKENRPSFDFGLFIAPVFASPVVFIPLLAAFQSLEIDMANPTIAKYMVFFVAFENGFFWKEFIDNRRKEKQIGK